MMNYKETNITGQPEYDIGFWNYLKGIPYAEDKVKKAKKTKTNSYEMPMTSEKKYDKCINEKSIFRNIASVFTGYGHDAIMQCADSDDIAEFVEEFGSISPFELKDDFTKISVDIYKLAAILKAPCELVKDCGFNFENYLIGRIADCFSRAEDKAFITGNGTTEPTGILHDTNGADTGVTTGSITYDDVIKLYFSVKPKYRRNGVWLMNDETAMTLRTIKDSVGNYLWRGTDDTILGKKVIISEFMPNAEDGTKPIAFGDFSYYWVIKRSNIQLKVLKELFIESNQLGYLACEFIDGKLIRKDAVKVMKIAEE